MQSLASEPPQVTAPSPKESSGQEYGSMVESSEGKADGRTDIPPR